MSERISKQSYRVYQFKVGENPRLPKDSGWAFSTHYHMKAIFNTITSEAYGKGGNKKDAFYWDGDGKLWVTKSEKSKKRAENEIIKKIASVIIPTDFGQKNHYSHVLSQVPFGEGENSHIISLLTINISDLINNISKRTIVLSHISAHKNITLESEVDEESVDSLKKEMTSSITSVNSSGTLALMNLLFQYIAIKSEYTNDLKLFKLAKANEKKSCYEYEPSADSGFRSHFHLDVSV